MNQNLSIQVTEADVSTIVGSFESELALCASLEAGIADALEVLGLPRAIDIKREVLLSPVRVRRRLKGVLRADFVIAHDGDEVTIIEAKNRPSAAEVAMGVSQLLLYLDAIYRPDLKVNLVLACDRLERAAQVVASYVGPEIAMLVVSDDRFAAVRGKSRASEVVAK